VVTLLLTPEDSQKLELAKNQGRISLSLRNPLDDSRASVNGPITAEVLDPNLNARVAQGRKNRGGRGGLDDPKLWDELTGGRKQEAKKEPEKPRAVVDVYRGDKHVQETFR
jgi:hypothetical protein